MRRAAHWDGWIVPTVDETGAIIKTPEAIAQCAATIRQSQEVGATPEIAVSGITEPDQAALVREYESAGATWWLESLFGLRGTIDALRRRIRTGPPA
jgi:hypothetical protein